LSAILAPGDYTRWLGEEPDPHDLMRPFAAEPMRMWPLSTRVNKPGANRLSVICVSTDCRLKIERRAYHSS
jgi:putative SOS response-associated peptidase YedK